MSSLPVTAFRRRMDRRGRTSTLSPAGPGIVPAPRIRPQEEAEAPARRSPRPFRAWPLVLADLAAVIGAALVLETRMPLVALAWLPLVGMAGGYEPRAFRSRLGELRWVTAAGSGLVALGVGLAALRDPASSRDALLVCLATASLSVLLRAGHGIGTGSLAGERRRTLRVLVAGRRQDVLRVVSELRRARGHEVIVVGACLPRNADAVGFDFPVTCGFDALVGAVRRDAANAVIVVPSKRLDVTRMRQLRWDLEPSCTLLLVAPGLADVAEKRTRLSTLGTMPLVHVRRTELAGPHHLFKECWERTAAFFALLVLLPLLAVLAVAIRLESPGPAVFRQVRVGRDGRTFTMYKLRTMTEQAESQLLDLQHLNEAGAVLFKVRQDPRVTRIGRVLRRYSLDELPQLANVVLGQMALVGPRPPLPCEVALYDEATWRRLRVKPGLTGLWQVSGRSDLPWPEAVRLDLEYVDNWSLALDLWITSRTFRAVLSHRGAY